MPGSVPDTPDTFVQMVKDKVDQLYNNIRFKDMPSRDKFILAIHECKAWFWNRDDAPGTFGQTTKIYYDEEQKQMDTTRALSIIKDHILPILRPFANTQLPDEIKTLKRDNCRIDVASTRDILVLNMQAWFLASDQVVAPRSTPPVATLDEDGWDGIARPSAPRAARARLNVLAAMRAQLSSINAVVLLRPPVLG